MSVQRVNALDYAAEIKQLFLDHGRPEFPEFFDRAYAHAASNGAASWLGRDDQGRLTMHLACFPRCFRFGERVVVGGLMVNIMVSKAWRTFFPALALVRRAVEHVKADGVIDFLYADPNEQAGAVLRPAGFLPVATLQRYVLPVGDRRPLADLAVRLYHGAVGARTGFPARASTVAVAASQVAAEPLRVPPASGGIVQPCHDRGFYASRMAGYPAAEDWWFAYSRRTGGEAGDVPAAALLVRGPRASGVADLRAVRRAPDGRLASLLPAFRAELRRRGGTRCQISTVAESAFARELRQNGFVPRETICSVLARALTPEGEACVAAIDSWEVTDVDFDR